MPDRNTETVLEERESIALLLCQAEGMQQANASDNVSPYSLGFAQGYVIRFNAVTILHFFLQSFKMAITLSLVVNEFIGW